jgi:hypothetical protein
MIVLLIFWCVWTTLEAGADFSFLDKVHVLKDRLVGSTRGLRDETPESVPDAGDAGDGGGQGKSGMLSRSGSLKKTFNRLCRPGRPRASTSSTLVNPNRNSGCGPPDATVVEMGEIDNKVSGR